MFGSVGTVFRICALSRGDGLPVEPLQAPPSATPSVLVTEARRNAYVRVDRRSPRADLLPSTRRSLRSRAVLRRTRSDPRSAPRARRRSSSRPLQRSASTSSLPSSRLSATGSIWPPRQRDRGREPSRSSLHPPRAPATPARPKAAPIDGGVSRLARLVLPSRCHGCPSRTPARGRLCPSRSVASSLAPSSECCGFVNGAATARPGPHQRPAAPRTTRGRAPARAARPARSWPSRRWGRASRRVAKANRPSRPSARSASPSA